LAAEVKDISRKKLRRVVLLLGNAILVIAILVLCLVRVNHNQERSLQESVDSFASNVASIRSLAYNVLETSQLACRDDALYIRNSEYTVDEALEYLSKTNSEVEIMYHIIDYDTLEGYSTIADRNGSYAVSYAGFEDSVSEGIDFVRQGKTSNGICITSTFTNPTTAYRVIGFLEDIILTEDDGSTGHYILVRVVPIDYISAKWSFPGRYADAELSLITDNGKYIIKSASLKSENFWEFIRIYNELGYYETDEIKESFYSGGQTVMQFKDYAGEYCYIACVPLTDKTSDLHFIAYIPSSSLETAQTDNIMIAIVTVGMLLILAFNILYIIDINRRLRRSNELANQASKAKTDFLSSMSHDIRTPMNAIIGLTAIASKNTDDPVRVKDCLDKISQAGKHLLTLINDILDISKIESGRFSLSPTVFSLKKMIDNEINIIQPQVKQKNLTLEVNTDKLNHDLVYADELRLNQIFINILSNAVKYTPDGGSVTVTVEEKIFANQTDKTHLSYKVQDTGIGMTPEFMKTMYEPFSRMVDTRIDQTQGTGLGLAITKKMIDLMGGSIDCISAPGKGSTFTVNLELPIARDKKRESEDTEATSGLEGLRLLVAEDNDMNWEIINELLSMHDIESERAANGQIALNMIEDKPAGYFDAILMDVHMPVMDGLSATSAIRQLSDKDKNSIPIIALTADAFTEDIQACLNAGMDAHTSKPVNMKKLFEALRKVIKK